MEIRSDLPLGLTQALVEKSPGVSSASKAAVLMAEQETVFSRYWKDFQTGAAFENSTSNTAMLKDKVVKRAHVHLARLLGQSQTLPDLMPAFYSN